MAFFRFSRRKCVFFLFHCYGMRAFYIERHNEMASGVMEAVGFVYRASQCDSLEVGDYLKAIKSLDAMKLGFKDVEMLLFKPRLHSLLNLVGVQYCLAWLGVRAKYVLKALQYCKILDRQVRIRWWKLGRLFYGFRMHDELHSCCLSG